MSEYAFPPAFPPDHFVSEYIAYASQLTDAAHDYHEACALALLATATPDLRAPIRQFPGGLRTNLYVTLVGGTSSSRKSTAKDIAKEIAKRVWPGVLLNEKATPEAFAQELSLRSKQASLWCVDEFAQQLVQMHKRDYMAGLAGLLLEIYAGEDYTYNRTQKPVMIQQPHLTIIGCTALTIFDKLHEDDVTSGLLPRFAIMFPDAKPPRRPFDESGDDQVTQRNALVQRLHHISPQRDANGQPVSGPRVARFCPAAMKAIDGLAAVHESQYDGELFRRLMPMALKVAMLSAVGRSFRLLNGSTDIPVTEDDAACALTVVQRWTRSAEAFQRQLGESRIERLVTKALEFVRKKGKSGIARRAVVRHLHVDAKTMAEVEKTLFDRELITNATDGKSTRCWMLLDDAKTP